MPCHVISPKTYPLEWGDLNPNLIYGSFGKETCIRRVAHWHNLTNTIEQSMYHGDMAFLSHYVDHLLLLGRIAALRTYAAYSYRPSSVVCRSVCRSVTLGRD